MIENASNLNSQAIELASTGDFREAIACLKKALTIETNNALLWFNLGITYRDSGNFMEARNALEKAHQINPSDCDTADTLALVCLSTGDFHAAARYCGEALEKHQNNPHLWNTFGIINFNMENYASASEAFEMAITCNPYYYDALFNLRDTYEELGNKAGVYQCIQQMRNIQGQK